MTYDRKEALNDLAFCTSRLRIAEHELKDRIVKLKRSITRAYDSGFSTGSITASELFEKTKGFHTLLGIADILDLQLLVKEVHDQVKEENERRNTTTLPHDLNP